MKKYIAGISGGPDSMAMLRMYHKKIAAVCVVNYKKRLDSHIDVKIVKEFCSLYNIKYYIHNVTPSFYAKHQKENFQSLARTIRYDFFVKIAKKLGINKIMIAHNLDDHMETAYVQFNKKSKSLFYGIARKSEYSGLKIIRPVLNFRKTTLMRYCHEKNVQFAIDSSNESDLYERNRIRKIIKSWSQEKIIEFIKKINKYNKKNKKIKKIVKKNFLVWSGNNYNLDFYKKNEKEVQYYLIYEFLKIHGEKNNSYNKITSIQSFLNSHNKINKYRLEKFKYLIIEKNDLKLI